MPEGNGEMHIKFLRKEHVTSGYPYPTNLLLICKDNRQIFSYMRELRKHHIYKVLWKKFCVFCLLGISNKIQTINRSKSMLIQRTSGRTWVTLSWGWIFLSNVNYIIGDMHYLPWQCKNNNVSNKYEEGKKRKDVVRGHENGNGLRFQRKKWRNNVYPLNLYFLKCFQLLIFCINFSWGIFYERNNVS